MRLRLLPLLWLLLLFPALAEAQTTLSDRSASGALTAAWNGTLPQPANTAVLVSLPSQNGIAVQLTGTFSGTVQFEALIDQARASWLAINGTPFAGGSSVSSATATGAWLFNVAGVKVFRVRCSAFTSGTIQVGIVSAVAVPPATATISGTVTTAGGKTNNNAAPGATNVGVLPGLANAAAPTWTEGNQVALSTDLSGNLRTTNTPSGTQTVSGTVTANAGTGTFTTAGALTNNSAIPGAANFGVLGALATAAVPSLTEGFQDLLSENLSGALRAAAEGPTANGSAVARPPVVVGGQFSGNVKILGLDTNGGITQGQPNAAGTSSWPIQGQAAAGATLAGNPVVTGVVDGSGNVQTVLQAAGGNGSVVTQVGLPAAGIALWNGVNSFRMLQNSNSIGDAATPAGALVGVSYVFNGSSLDRQRNNIDASIRASTGVTVQTINTDITTYNAAAFMYHANVTNYNGGTLTVSLQWKDANGLFVTIPGATTGALSSGADIILAVGPSAWPANTATAFYVNYHIPRLIRVVETVSTATITMSNAYELTCQ